MFQSGERGYFILYSILAILMIQPFSSSHQFKGETPLETYDSTNPKGINSSCEPILVYPEEGDDLLYVIWQDYREDYWTVYFRKSENFGSDWSSVEIPISGHPSAYDSFNPSITAGSTGERIHVVWESFDAENDVAFICYTRSDDYGNTWTIPTILQETDRNAGILDLADPTVACDASGVKVYIAWSRYEKYFDDVKLLNRWRKHIYAGRSEDGGASWTDIQPINDNRKSDETGVSFSYKPVLKCSSNGERVYVSYLDNRKPQKKKYNTTGYRRPSLPVNIFAHGPVEPCAEGKYISYDPSFLSSILGYGGDPSIVEPQNENATDPKSNGREHSSPTPICAGMSDNGPYASEDTYDMESESDPGYAVYFAHSVDSGVSYGADTVLCHGKGEDCCYLTMVMEKKDGISDRIYVAWTSNSEIKNMPYPFYNNVFLNRSDDGGESWWGQVGHPEILRIDQEIPGE
ncbi:MAG: sialidase family protein, partial [Planctomycetota bacterium]